MAHPAHVGHIEIMGCVVCHGCGCLVYTAADSLARHLNDCVPLQRYNRERATGEPM